MIVSIVGDKIVWYEFLCEELQKQIKREITTKYPPSKYRRNAYDVDDNSAIGKLLNAIDYLVDLYGARAIDWINEKEIKYLLSNMDKVKKEQLPPPTQKPKHSFKFYEDALIRFGDGDLIKLQNNPNIAILFSNPSYTTAKDFAIKYLKENDLSKRVYISSCKEWNVNVVWVRKA